MMHALKTSTLALGILALMAAPASATYLDLRTAGADGFINDAYFIQVPDQSTGTGVIEPFVRVHDGGNAATEQDGFNTDGTLYFDEKAGLWTHSLLLSEVPEVTLDGTVYYQFLLDINQNRGGDNEFLSLYELQVLTGSTPSPTGATIDADGLLSFNESSTLWYDLDGLEDSYIDLNYLLNPGSGGGDMFFYMPKPAGIDEDVYLYLYSNFGVPYPANDGFEEWAIIGTGGGGTDSETPVPEPGSMILLGSGLILVANRFRRSRKTR